MIPIFLKRAQKNEDITITGTGEQTRDFLYVLDASRALKSALGHPGVYNVGSGHGASIREIAEKAVALTRSSSEIIHTGSDVPVEASPIADGAKAERELGFLPSIDLSKGMMDLAQWLKDQ